MYIVLMTHSLKWTWIYFSSISEKTGHINYCTSSILLNTEIAHWLKMVNTTMHYYNQYSTISIILFWSKNITPLWNSSNSLLFFPFVFLSFILFFYFFRKKKKDQVLDVQRSFLVESQTVFCTTCP